MPMHHALCVLAPHSVHYDPIHHAIGWGLYDSCTVERHGAHAEWHGARTMEHGALGMVHWAWCKGHVAKGMVHGSMVHVQGGTMQYL